MPQVSQMECVEPLFLSGVECPRLAAVANGTEDASSVYSHLSVDGQPHTILLVTLAKAEAARPIRLFISVSKARSSDTIDFKGVN